MRMRAGTGLVVGLIAALAACGGDDDPGAVPSTSAAIATSTAPAPSTSAPPATVTTAPLTTGASSTTAPATTAPETTAPDTTAPVPTSTVPARAGWEPIEFVPSVFPVGYSGNFEGTPSPAAPADAASPLADGYYHAELAEPWSPDDPGVLHIEIAGFAPCDQLPGVCNENPDAVELGIDPSWSRSVDFLLDDSSRVIVRGGRCGGADEIGVGPGAALADLFSAYSEDYATVITPLLSDGFDTIVAAVGDGSSGGFRTEEQVCDASEAGLGPFRYEYVDAPMLLIQAIAVFNEDPPQPIAVDELVHLNGVEVRDGVITPYFYAGFSS